MASVLGRRFSFGHLSAMLTEQPSALLTPVDDLLRADLLTEDDGLLAYRHDLIREAVRDTLPPTALRALQLQAVDALLAAGSPAVEVAAQLAASAEPGDQAAVHTLREAARALGSSDPGAAARAHLCALGETERLTIVPLCPMDAIDEVPLVRIAMAAGDGELATSAVATARERLSAEPGRSLDRRHRCSRRGPGDGGRRAPRPRGQVLRRRTAAARPGLGARGRGEGPGRARRPGRKASPCSAGRLNCTPMGVRPGTRAASGDGFARSVSAAASPGWSRRETAGQG